jgi:hypothetical protein
MGEKKKCVDHVIEKEETKFMSIFTHQNFLVKVVKLLRVVF